MAIITGGARRVGRAVGLHLARRGYDLFVTYKSSVAEAESLAAEAEGLGARCELIDADLTADDSPVRISGSFTRIFSRLDLLVHNASIFPKGTLEETSREVIRDVFKVHVETPLLLTKHMAPLLRATKGSVIAMGDLAADRPFKQHLAYSASKAALENLTIGLARTLAPEARANVIAPGAVEWPESMTEEQRAAYLKRVPLGHVGTSEDVARAVWFLAEEAPFVTGTVLRLDGGRSVV